MRKSFDRIKATELLEARISVDPGFAERVRRYIEVIATLQSLHMAGSTIEAYERERVELHGEILKTLGCQSEDHTLCENRRCGKIEKCVCFALHLYVVDILNPDG